jgi:hypothetical protein
MVLVCRPVQVELDEMIIHVTLVAYLESGIDRDNRFLLSVCEIISL